MAVAYFVLVECMWCAKEVAKKHLVKRTELKRTVETLGGTS